MSVSILSGLDMKPCTRSELVSRRITGSPFLRVISLGVNSNFFAVISITFGLSFARASLVFGATTASAIPKAPASSIVLTILFLNIVAFIVGCVSGFELGLVARTGGGRSTGSSRCQLIIQAVQARRRDSWHARCHRWDDQRSVWQYCDSVHRNRTGHARCFGTARHGSKVS